MAKEYFDQKIDRTYDWGGDKKTGGLQVKGNRVQEYIQESLDNLGAADVASEKMNPSVFGGFVDNVSLKNQDAGSDYVKVVYDLTRHMFFAVTIEDETEKYHRQYDKFNVYNDGEYPNAFPYNGKLYVCGGDVWVGDGTGLVKTTAVANEADVRAIVSTYGPEPEPENEESES